MSLSPDQAAASLKEIERAGQRSAQALRYARSSPFFILWGVVWIIGYASSDLIQRLGYNPRLISWLWMGLSVAGMVCTILISSRQHRAQYAADERAERHARLRWMGGALVVCLFVIAMGVVIGPHFGQVSGVFFPLLIAMFYGLTGIQRGVRFFFASITVTALTLGGYLYLQEYFLLWMAAVGGGSLILVGLWMRKI
jgi:hypothetical protein